MGMPVRYIRPQWSREKLPRVYDLNRLSDLSDDRLQELADITDERLVELRADAVVTAARNKELYETAKEDHKALCTTVGELYGTDSLQVKYIRKHTPDYLSQDWSEQYFDQQIAKPVAEARGLLTARAKYAAIKAADELYRTDRLQRAIAYLTERGKVIGTDFTLEDAEEKASNIAYTEAVANKVAEMVGGFVIFDGDTNCEDCAGWDGVSSRCQCGCRRVYWSPEYCTFDSPTLYPRAH